MLSLDKSKILRSNHVLSNDQSRNRTRTVLVILGVTWLVTAIVLVYFGYK